MMKKYSLLFLFCIYFFFPLNAQWLQAHLKEDGTIKVTPTTIQNHLQTRSDFQQLDGFPKRMPANQTFKNFRNVALADLNNDGTQEIITGINNTLYAFSHKGLLWEKTIIGTALYPPTVADIDGDGLVEIALSTGGAPNPCRLYLVNSFGEDLKGWPLNFDDNWMITAPVFSDVDNDGKMEIIAAERDAPAGNIHLLTLDGNSFNSNWPQRLDKTPAVTPSVGDVDGDGEKEIIAFFNSYSIYF